MKAQEPGLCAGEFQWWGAVWEWRGEQNTGSSLPCEQGKAQPSRAEEALSSRRAAW